MPWSVLLHAFCWQAIPHLVGSWAPLLFCLLLEMQWLEEHALECAKCVAQVAAHVWADKHLGNQDGLRAARVQFLCISFSYGSGEMQFPNKDTSLDSHVSCHSAKCQVVHQPLLWVGTPPPIIKHVDAIVEAS